MRESISQGILENGYFISFQSHGKGRIKGYLQLKEDNFGISVSKDISSSITLAFPYNPQSAEKVKAIPRNRWHHNLDCII